MLIILWGFFIYSGSALILNSSKFKVQSSKIGKRISFAFAPKAGSVERVLMVLFLFSLVLIVIPEGVYFKDIYPAHFRSNTMFKLGYQAFILFSIVS